MELFRAVFDDWHARADVLSALPDAPVVPDDPPRRRRAWRWPRPAPRARTVPAATCATESATC
jgi:hypothetical protein